MSKRLSVKACQEKLLELLILIHESCQELGLNYWLDGGTLLGAVRHEDFIPWDDDLDVCLRYDDFQKLTQHLHQLCEQHEHLVCYTTVQPPTHPTEKLGDVRILSEGIFPVHIDIVLVKAVPELPDRISNDKSLANIAHFFKSGKFKNRKDVLAVHQSYLPQQPSEFLEKKKAFFYYLHHEYFPQCNQFDETNVFNYAQNDMLVKRDRHYYQYDDIFPLQKITFAGYEFLSPGNTDAYLSKLYGPDYLTPPPLSQQRPANISYLSSNLSKGRVLQRMQLHFSREYQHFIARSEDSSWKRMFHKLLSFCELAAKSIKQKDYVFVFTYLRYTFTALWK